MLGYRNIMYKWKITPLLPEQGLTLPFIAWRSHNCFLCLWGFDRLPFVLVEGSLLQEDGSCRILWGRVQFRFALSFYSKGFHHLPLSECGLSCGSQVFIPSLPTGARMRRGWPLAWWDTKGALSEVRWCEFQCLDLCCRNRSSCKGVYCPFHSRGVTCSGLPSLTIQKPVLKRGVVFLSWMLSQK